MRSRTGLPEAVTAAFILFCMGGLFATSGTAGFVSAGTLLAQSRPMAQNEPPAISSRRTINLTEQDRHTIREIVLKDTHVSKAPANVTATIGDPAPADVVSYEFPPQISGKITALQSHRFFVTVDDEIFVVDSKAGRIADIVKAETAK
jgi:hypothetical protein